MKQFKKNFMKTHNQRDYEKYIVSLLCGEGKVYLDESQIELFSLEEIARLGYLLELCVKIAQRCEIDFPESLSKIIPILKQKIEASEIDNIPLFEEWVPGSTTRQASNILGSRWRLKNELVFKNIENEVKRWMICIKKPLNNS